MSERIRKTRQRRNEQKVKLKKISFSSQKNFETEERKKERKKEKK